MKTLLRIISVWFLLVGVSFSYEVRGNLDVRGALTVTQSVTTHTVAATVRISAPTIAAQSLSAPTITSMSTSVGSLKVSAASLSASAQTAKTDIIHLENRADQNDVRDAEDTLMADYSRRVVWNDGLADQFNNQTGVDITGTATTARYNIGYYTTPLNPGYGSGVDGNFTIGATSNMFSTDVYGTANHGYSPYSSMPVTSATMGLNVITTATPPLGITNGDEVAIISLQGFHSAVDTTNGAHYAHVGKYEFANVSSIVDRRVTFTPALTNTYWESNLWQTTADSNYYKVAICRVGQWQDMQIPAGATNTVSLWNGFQTTNKWGQVNTGVIFMRAKNLNVAGKMTAWSSGYRGYNMNETKLGEGVWGYISAANPGNSFLDSSHYQAGGSYAATGTFRSGLGTSRSGTLIKGDSSCSTLHMGGGGMFGNGAPVYKQSGGIIWIAAETTTITGLVTVGNAESDGNVSFQSVGAAGTLVLSAQTFNINNNALCASGTFDSVGFGSSSGGRVRLNGTGASINWVSGVGGNGVNPAASGSVTLGGEIGYNAAFQIKSVSYNINLTPTNGYFGVVDKGSGLTYSVLDGSSWRSVTPVTSTDWGSGWSYRTSTYSVCGTTNRTWKCNSTGDVNAALHAVTIIEKE